MKPFISGKYVANWLLRIALGVMLYLLYSNIISTLTFSNPSFLIAATALLFGGLLIFGGLLAKPGLTTLSGLAISLISVYKIIVSFNGAIDHYLAMQIIPLSIGFYFVTNGNDH